MQILYEQEPVAALAIDQLPGATKMSVAVAWLLFDLLNRIDADPSLLDAYKLRLLEGLPGYLAAPADHHVLSIGTLPTRASVRGPCGNYMIREGETGVRLVEEGMGLAGDLLWDLDLLLQNYVKLPPLLQQVISEGIHRAAVGKRTLLSSGGRGDLSGGKAIAEYNLQCHLSSGILWITLSRLCSAASVECPGLGNEEHLSNALGLLSQKAAWLCGLREQLKLGESRWPQAIWELYAVSEPRELIAPENWRNFGYFRDHLCLDAARSIPNVYQFLSRLEDPEYFRLCAIPQVSTDFALEIIKSSPLH